MLYFGILYQWKTDVILLHIRQLDSLPLKKTLKYYYRKPVEMVLKPESSHDIHRGNDKRMRYHLQTE